MLTVVTKRIVTQLRGAMTQMKFKKLLLPVIVGALALSLAACGGKDELSESQVEKDAVVVVVNDEELKGEQYNAIVSSIEGQMQEAGADPFSEEGAEQVKAQALDMVINQTLILQKAKEEKIEASEIEAEEKYASFLAQFGDEEAMTEAFKSQNIGIKEIKKQLTDSIIFQKYSDKVLPVEDVTKEEIQEYYDMFAEQSKDSEQELPAFEDVQEEIGSILKENKQQELLAAHLEELKKDAKIEQKI